MGVHMIVRRVQSAPHPRCARAMRSAVGAGGSSRKVPGNRGRLTAGAGGL